MINTGLLQCMEHEILSCQTEYITPCVDTVAFLQGFLWCVCVCVYVCHQLKAQLTLYPLCLLYFLYTDFLCANYMWGSNYSVWKALTDGMKGRKRQLETGVKIE